MFFFRHASWHGGRHGGPPKKILADMLLHMVADKVAGMVADMGVGIVANKVAGIVADMAADKKNIG